jgi:hypothetical protein
MSIHTTPRVAIATCKNLPGWEIDDQPFLNLLKLRADVSMCAWTDVSIDWAVFDCVLVRTTWDYSERIDEFRDWVKRVGRVTRILNPSGWLEWNCNKWYLRDLEQEGIHIAPTQWLTHTGDVSLAQAVALSPQINRWFLKPTIGASSSNTLRFSLDEVPDAEAFLLGLLPEYDFMLQPYLDSVESFGEVSLLYIGGNLTHSVRKVPVAGDYRVQDDYGAHDEPYAPSLELEHFGAAILTAAARVQSGLEPLLYARLDFLKDHEDRFVLNELELIEPSLFFRHGPAAPQALVTSLLEVLG